jgi:hypothetical protein
LGNIKRGPTIGFCPDFLVILTVDDKMLHRCCFQRRNRAEPSSTPIMPLLTKTPLVLILPTMASRQNTSILGGTIPFHIHLKEMKLLDRQVGESRPHRLDRVHPIQLGFQINLSLVSLDSTTLDNRPNKELNKLISLSLRDLLHLKFHIQFKLSHIPILAIEEALSCERLKSLGNCSANLELPSHRSFQKLVSHSLPTTTQISFLTIF